MIEKIISKALSIDEDMVKDDSNFVQDLGADSLNTVEIIMDIEEEYGISIPDEDAEGLVTVKDLKEYIKEYA